MEFDTGGYALPDNEDTVDDPEYLPQGEFIVSKDNTAEQISLIREQLREIEQILLRMLINKL